MRTGSNVQAVADTGGTPHAAAKTSVQNWTSESESGPERKQEANEAGGMLAASLTKVCHEDASKRRRSSVKKEGATPSTGVAAGGRGNMSHTSSHA